MQNINKKQDFFVLHLLFKSFKAYTTAAIRLIIIPVIFGTVFYLAGFRGESYIIPVMMTAMPVGMNVVVFAEASGRDSKDSARICFVSYLVAFITVPIGFGLLTFFK